MNWHHFGAFLWLNWRLRVNQIKRGGIANQIILVIVAVNLALAAIVLLFGSFGLAFVLAEIKPIMHLFIWDGLVVAFLSWWCVGLMVELQRSEALSLTKFLHLPVSLWGVFVLNYLSSLMSLTMLLFVPASLGFSLGLVFAVGPIMLLMLPLVLSFLLMVTALTYQFQGWLASLMVNKRRRRTIIFIVTLAFILVFQLPNLINMIRPWEVDQTAKVLAQKTKEERSQTWQQVQDTAWYINAAVPGGWLPLGAHGLADGNVVPALLGILGMASIGAASLWRAYRTTVRLYLGTYSAGAAAPAPVIESSPERKRPEPASTFIASQLPGLSEPAAAVTLASFRSLTRAPEARMLLLTPVFMLVVFAGMFWQGRLDLPIIARPLLAFGAITMMLLTLVQLIGNQFGFDRSGFRVYVLSPAPRADILLGKNLGILPLTFFIVLPVLIVIQLVHPLRADHFAALWPQFISMYLLFCLLANLLSIYVPMPIAAGSLKPVKTSLAPILLQMLFTMAMMHTLALTLLPLGIELVLELLDWRHGIPVCLILTLAQSVAVVWLYRRMLGWEGSLLQGREQRILEVVTTKAE